MRFSLLLTLAATSVAASSTLQSIVTRQAWTPAAGTATTCDTTDKLLSFAQGPQLDSVVNNACAALMPPCAYQQRLPPGTFCAQSIDFSLPGPKSVVQVANVLSAQGNKISGYAAQFSVNPPYIPSDSDIPQVQWSRQECVGYFSTILDKPAPLGCHGTKGSSVGNLIVGGKGPLAGTLMTVTIVPRPQT